MYARPLFLIASGPSRKEFPIGDLKGEGHFVMGINRVVREIPLTHSHFQDVNVFAKDVVKYQDSCMVVIPGDSPMVEMNDRIVVFRYPRTRIPRVGSGMTGLFLAGLMGFNPIFLVGYDYNDGIGHDHYSQDMHRLKEFNGRFPEVEVYQVSKRSSFKMCKFRSFEDCRHGEI